MAKKCTNGLKKKVVFDHTSRSHTGLQLRSHLIFVLFIFLALWFVTVENMSNVLDSCSFSTRTFSPHYVEPLPWNDPQKLCNVWTVRNDGVAFSQSAEPTGSLGEQKGEMMTSCLRGVRSATHMLTLSILSLPFSWEKDCVASSYISTFQITWKQIYTFGVCNKSYILCVLCLCCTINNKKCMIVFNFLLPNYRKMMSELCFYLFKRIDFL